MNLICPKCNVVYKIDNQKLLPNGKTVRCTKCHHVWFEKYSILTMKDNDHYPLPMVVKKGKKNKIKTSSAIMVILLFSVLFFTALIMLRESIMHNFPRTSTLYDQIGMSSTKKIILEGFEIIRLHDNQNDIEVSGMIVNKSEVKKKIPKIKISLVDKEGKIIRTIIPDITRDSGDIFAPEEQIPFTYQIKEIPQETYMVSVKIAGLLDLLTSSDNT